MSDSDRPGASSAQPASSPPRRFTRRRVMVGGAAVVATGVVGAGGYAAVRAVRRYGRQATDGIVDHRIELPAKHPQLAIVRGGDPAGNVRAALRALGGLSVFVSRGDIVLLKPNAAWDRAPAYAANTHPQVVAELVRSCREAGAAEVIVTDCPVHEARRAFRVSGILDAAEAAGARVLLPEAQTQHAVKLSDRLGVWDVPEAFVRATKILNVPIVKHHGSATVTAGMKNWIGVTAKGRGEFHTDLHQTIAELAALMRPTLTILDATRVLVRNGPKGGNLDDVKKLGALAASVDPVAADAWASEQLGAKLEEVEYLGLAERMGLGKVDYRALRPVEISA